MKKKEPVIETDRLLLRPWREEDAEDMYRYAKNPEVGPNAGWKPHERVEESIEISKRWAENWKKGEPKGDLEFALELKETGKVVGSLGLDNDGWRTNSPNSWCMGYVLGREYWGQGLMPEAAAAAIDYAFGPLRAKLLCINHYPDNLRSRRVIEKCGFTYEGTLRRATVLFDGTVKDLCCYSMTAAEYHLCKAKERKLSLVLPEEVPPAELEACRKEWGEEGKNPAAFFRNGRSGEEWLEHVIAFRTHTPPHLVPSTLYILVDAQGRPLGALDLRHTLNADLLQTGGHIGYGIRPMERKKGYASCMLALGLEKAREKRIDRVLVTCLDNNPASAATIEACGGVLENKVDEDGELLRRYWIAL